MAIALVLKKLFGKESQFDSIEDASVRSTGQVVMPIMAYEPRRIKLKTTAIKDTYCNARFSVFSKLLEDTKECSRFILPKREITKEELLDKLPNQIKDANFDYEEQHTFFDLIQTLSAIPADKVAFFYNAVVCEGNITYCVAIIHQFGKEEDPYCVCTCYFSISVNK